MKRFYWETEIVSIEDDIVTFKGGEQKKFSPTQLRLVTDKKSTAQDLKDRKLQFFQAFVFEAFDTLDMNDRELFEAIEIFKKKWDADKGNKILELLGIKSFEEITFRVINK